MPSSETYTINEAAALTGLHRNTIRQKIKLGLLEATVRPGKYGDEYRITREALYRAGLLSRPGDDANEQVEAEVLDGERGGPVDASPGRSEAGGRAERGEVPASALRELYERHEQAMFRLGYLQAELEQMKALAERAESLQEDNAARRREVEELREALQAREREAAEAERLRRELERAREQLAELEQLRRDLEQLKSLAARQEAVIAELEAERKRPWWRRLGR